MAGRKKTQPTWIRYSSIGFEFAAAVAGFALVGYWIDRHYDTGPWGILIGSALGIVGATYNLIRQTLALSRDSSPRKPESDGPP